MDYGFCTKYEIGLASSLQHILPSPQSSFIKTQSITVSNRSVYTQLYANTVIQLYMKPYLYIFQITSVQTVAVHTTREYMAYLGDIHIILLFSRVHSKSGYVCNVYTSNNCRYINKAGQKYEHRMFMSLRVSSLGMMGSIYQVGIKYSLRFANK